MTKQKSVMLGEISARELHGPWADFMDKLQNENGREDWFEPFKKFLRKEDPWERKKNYTVLTPHEEFIVGPLTKSFSPHKFFKTGDGLWVSDKFAERILSVAKVVKPGEAVSLRSFNLMREASDSDIRTEFLGEGLTELWQIAEIIRYQSNSEEGRLLNNGYANIFYVRGKGGEVFVVYVRWHGNDRQWFVDARPLGESGRWFASRRVFGPATDFLSL